MGAEINVKNLFALFDSLSGLRIRDLKTLLEDYESKKAAIELDVDLATLQFPADDSFVKEFVHSMINKSKIEGKMKIAPYFLRTDIDVFNLDGNEINDFKELKWEYKILSNLVEPVDMHESDIRQESDSVIKYVQKRYEKFFEANKRAFEFIESLGDPRKLMELLCNDENGSVKTEVMKEYWASKLRKHYVLDLEPADISRKIDVGNSTSIFYAKIKGEVISKILLSPECQDFSIGVGSKYLGDDAKCLLNGTPQNGATILFSYDRGKIKRGQYPLCDFVNAFASLKRLLPYIDVNPLLVELLSSGRSL